MNESEQPYSDAVIAAVESGRNVTAIKLLREETGLGLNEARQAIEALNLERQQNPEMATRMVEEGGAGGMIKMVLLVAIILGVYFYFFAS